MEKLTAQFFDGQSSKPHSGFVTFVGSIINFETDDGFTWSTSIKQLKPHPIMGNVVRVVDGPAGERLEIQASESLDELLYPDKKSNLVHGMERDYKLVTVAVIGIVAILFAGYKIGIPAFANFIVPKLPASVGQSFGDQTQEYFKRFNLMKPSSLSQERQQQILSQLNDITDPNGKFKINFGFVSMKYPNAYALPNGQIFFTDSFIKIMPSIDHIRAVALHEVGHIYYEHSMQAIAKSALLSVMIFAVTGNVADAGALPLVLMNTSYSRDAEKQSDLFAAKALIEEGKSPVLLAEALEAMEKEYEKLLKDKDKGGLNRFEFLSSHPNTKKRSEYLRAIR